MRQYFSPEGQELGRPAICYNPPGLAPARILMLAPEPFFEPRGTPFSEYHRIKALGELGYHVDLVTYPFGRDVDLPNLRIFRCWRPPFVQRVRIGPSLTKLVLDVVLAAKAMTVARATRYDAIHSHEEAGLLGYGWPEGMGFPICTTCTPACRSSLPTSDIPVRGERSGCSTGSRRRWLTAPGW